MLHLQFASEYEDENVRKRVLRIYDGDLRDIVVAASSLYAKVYAFSFPIKGEVRAFFYKEYLFRHTRDRLQVLFRGSRGKRDQRGARLLRKHGFRSPITVCVGEERHWGIITRSFTVSTAAPGTTVEHYLQKVLTDRNKGDRVIQKRQVIVLLGREIGRLHGKGIVHGDLRTANIFVREENPPEICLIDNERTRRYWRMPKRQRLRNLVQLNLTQDEVITRGDRLRFFSAYLQENPKLIPLRKEWLYRVVSKTRGRLLQKKRVAE